MKGNEINLTLRNRGFERGTQHVLMQLAEEIEDIQRTLKEVASAFESLVTVQGMLNNVADELKERLDKMKPNETDMGPTREGLN